MFSVVLVHPEIPPNTGNIIRLCANTGCQLHLIEPLGFTLQEKSLRRAGLDYREFANIRSWKSWSEFTDHFSGRILSFSTRHSTPYSAFRFLKNDALVFGSEGSGLPEKIRSCIHEQHRLHLPMTPQSRSLNLSNAVSVVVYEAWRQHGFEGTASVTATGPPA
ncbi:MAG: tRNA (cytidine(34)-2'-O)-methyltransferase [Pseudomonadota bacterium]